MPMLFRESFLNSEDNRILSTGNSRISKNSLFVEARLPYSLGSYSPAIKLNDKNTGRYKVTLLNNKGEKKDMGFLERKGDGTSRYFIHDCKLNLDIYNKICISLNDVIVLCGKFKIPSGFF